MRWERLFADLEAQIGAADRADWEAEIADRSRREHALIPLADRCRASLGAALALHVGGAGTMRGQLIFVGSEWLVIAEEGVETLVPFAALLSVTGLSAQSASAGGDGLVATRLRLTSALRALARDRAAVAVTLLDGLAIHGTLDRVGQDYVELAVHDPWLLRRSTDVRSLRAIPLAALAAVRRVRDRQE